MTDEQRARHNTYHREYWRNRYYTDPAFRQAVIERAKKRCTKKRPAAALSKEQLDRRRASDAARQARHRADKKATSNPAQ